MFRKCKNSRKVVHWLSQSKFVKVDLRMKFKITTLKLFLFLNLNWSRVGWVTLGCEGNVGYIMTSYPEKKSQPTHQPLFYYLGFHKNSFLSMPRDWVRKYFWELRKWLSQLSGYKGTKIGLRTHIKSVDMLGCHIAYSWCWGRHGQMADLLGCWPVLLDWISM